MVAGTRASSWRARAELATGNYLKLAERRPLLGLPLAFVTRYAARQGMLLAGAVAFRMFLWLLPLSLLLAGIMAGLSTSGSDTPASAAKAAGITGATRQQVVTALREGHRSWWVAVIIGGLTTLWAARALSRHVVLVNAHLWQVEARRMSPRRAGENALVLVFVVLVVLGLGAATPKLAGAIPGGLAVAIVVEVIGVAAAWMLLCLRLPDARTTWRDLLPGVVLFGVTMTLANVVSRVYLPHKIQHASQLYGSLGVAGTVAGWLLIIGQIVVASALLNVVMLDHHRQRYAVPSAGSPGQDDAPSPARRWA